MTITNPFRQMRSNPAAALLAGIAVFAGTPVGVAHDYSHGALMIEHPWSRATTPNAPTGAVYMVIENTGDTDDRLLSAVGDAADRIEIHSANIDDEGVMRMRELEDGLALPAGERVSLEPGGYHIMLINLESQLVEGEIFPLTLNFDQAGDIAVDIHVESIHGIEDNDHHHDH